MLNIQIINFAYNYTYMLIALICAISECKNIIKFQSILKMQNNIESILQTDSPEYLNAIQKLKRAIKKQQTLKQLSPSQIPGTNLLLGNYTHSTNPQLLMDLGIKLVVSCVKIDQRDITENVGIKYEEILFRDHRDANLYEQISRLFAILSQFTMNQDSKVLISCFSGKSRSVGITLGYLMKTRHLSFKEAIELVGQACNTDAINSGFIEQLNQYEEMLKMEQIFSVQNQSAVKEGEPQEKQQEVHYQEEQQKQSKEGSDKDSNYQVLKFESSKDSGSSSKQSEPPNDNKQQDKLQKIEQHYQQHQNMIQIQKQTHQPQDQQKQNQISQEVKQQQSGALSLGKQQQKDILEQQQPITKEQKQQQIKREEPDMMANIESKDEGQPEKVKKHKSKHNKKKRKK